MISGPYDEVIRGKPLRFIVKPHLNVGVRDQEEFGGCLSVLDT